MDYLSHSVRPSRGAGRGVSVVATLPDDRVSKFHRSPRNFPSSTTFPCRPTTTTTNFISRSQPPPLPFSCGARNKSSPSSSGGYAGHSPSSLASSSPFQLVPSPRSLSPPAIPCNPQQFLSTRTAFHSFTVFYKTPPSRTSSRSCLVASGHQCSPADDIIGREHLRIVASTTAAVAPQHFLQISGEPHAATAS